MEEIGVVTELGRDGLAFVRTSGGEACGSCGCKGACQALGGGADRRIAALNRAGAIVGDEVLITIGSGSFLKASFIVYVLPILALVVGSVMGQKYSTQIWAGAKPETASIVLGLFSLGACFIAIRLFKSRFSQNRGYYPVIERVIGPSEKPGLNRDIRES